MDVKTPQASYANWLRKSAMAYLEGERDLKWIVGVLGSDVGNAIKILADLRTYGDPERYRALLSHLEQRSVML
jgi:hypothetical protein